MMQIKFIIEKFILSGTYPVHKKVKLTEQKKDASILFEHPKYTTSTQHTHNTSRLSVPPPYNVTTQRTQVHPTEQQEERTQDKATSSKDITEKIQPSTGQDELNQYLSDIYKMYESHQTDDAMYRVMQLGLEKYTAQIKDI